MPINKQIKLSIAKTMARAREIAKGKRVSIKETTIDNQTNKLFSCKRQEVVEK